MKLFVLLAAVIGAACGSAFLEEGKEYVYDEEGAQISATLDYQPTAAGIAFKGRTRMQVHGNKINVKFENFKYSQYNGDFVPGTFDWDTATTFTPFSDTWDPISITYRNGKVDFISVPSTFNKMQANLMKAWATNWQISLENRAHDHAFAAKEKLIHGECQVHYTKNDHVVTRSVSHMADCVHRKFRWIDNWRGNRCDGEPHMEAHEVNGEFEHGRESPEPMFSNSETFYMVDKIGDRYKVNKMVTSMKVNAQFFESKGVSHNVYFRRSLTLVDEKDSRGDITIGSTINMDDLSHDWADSRYTWNDDESIYGAEPFYSAHGENTNTPAVVEKAKAIIAGMVDNFEAHDNSERVVDQLHKYGTSQLVRPLMELDHRNLMQLFTEAKTWTGKGGIAKRNIFTETIGSVGTRPAALVVKDAIEAGMFDNDRDAARALTSVAFHIRRPNEALYNAFKNIRIPAGNTFTQMAHPLARAHLARRTCELAGPQHHMDDHSADFGHCIRTISDPLADEAMARFNSGDYEAKMLALSEMINLRWGKVADLMEPIYNGETGITDDAVRARAAYAAVFGTMAHHNTVEKFLPVFLKPHNGHELRIAALRMIFYSHPDATTLSTIMTSLYFEQDYEVLNFAYTLFEKYANSINPCNNAGSHQSLAKYFLKYMNQAGFHKANYGFGISKTYAREFQKEKYGYGGAYDFYTVGSHDSTTPLVVGLAISNNQFHGYQNTLFQVQLRIEGLAKALIRKFKKVPEAEWKLSDLYSVLQGMGVRAKPDQPVRVEVGIALKGVVVIQRLYDESDAGPGGKIAEFLKTLSGAAKSGGYSINHQRALLVGESIYEQPTDSGFPMAYLTWVSTMVSIQADVNAQSVRGTLGREVNYDLHMFSQGTNAMLFHDGGQHNSYAVYQDRVYGFHSMRTVKAKVNLLGEKFMTLTVTRPPYDHPLMAIMHSKTVTAIYRYPAVDPTEDVGLANHCRDCHQFHTLTKGQTEDRVFVDRTNENVGSYMHGEYFRCEMDIAKKNTVGNALRAFMPWNKNPRTPWTMFTMGMRQIRAFFFYFPRAEQCGAFFRWSQSQTNPVTEINIKVMAKAQQKPTSKLFLRGRRVLIKMDVVAKGTDDAHNRVYKVNAEYDTEPGNLQNKLTFKVSRRENAALGMAAHMICMSYKSKYPDFGDEFMTVDMSQDLQVKGTAMINYGSGSGGCAALPTGIKVDFLHSTTAQSRAEVQNTWNAQQCEVDKRKAEWAERVSHGAAPMTEACFWTNYDAARARKYTWKAQFKGLTERLKTIIAKAQTAMKAGMMPYWDVDPEALSGPIGNSPFLKMMVEFKNNEETVDIRMQTSHGNTEMTDIPVRLPGWTNRLRNLKFAKTVPRLMQADIINPCIQTTQHVQTTDNTTLAYQPQSCWSLISAHCSEKPVYAVFTRASGSGIDLMAYLGGHKVEITKGGVVTVDGTAWNVVDHEEKVDMEGDQEIFKLLKWGSTYNIYSFLKVWIMYDGTFVEVVPAPSVKGQHCGVCGNYDNNRKNELLGKNGQKIAEENLATEWCQ